MGMRVGSGLTKALSNLLGESRGCRIMADLIFEACDAVILSLTAQQMAMAESLDEQDREQVSLHGAPPLNLSQKNLQSSVPV